MGPSILSPSSTNDGRHMIEINKNLDQIIHVKKWTQLWVWILDFMQERLIWVASRSAKLAKVNH
jgi:hypothetical protein